MRLEPLTDRHQVGFSCGEPVLDRGSSNTPWPTSGAACCAPSSPSTTPQATRGLKGRSPGTPPWSPPRSRSRSCPAANVAAWSGLEEIGAALIARLARDQRHTGRGLSAWLLQQALHRIIDANEHLAIRAVIVDALNERAASWYQGWGFKPLPGGPADRLWLPMKRVRASLGR